MYDLIIIGGGAAGIFAAITAKEHHPHLKVLILEKTKEVLTKVRLSGGGRCNVTNALFDPKLLVQNYPRGKKELLGPFSKFQPESMIAWLHNHGVQTHEEGEGRIFPMTNQSNTIIHCFLSSLKECEILKEQEIKSISKKDNHFFIETTEGSFSSKKLLLATGSSPDGYRFSKHFGHTIQDPVPSLFALITNDTTLHELSGLSIPQVEVSINRFSEKGPLLITHFGFSGPSILKLSSQAARHLHLQGYKDTLVVNWIPEIPFQESLNILTQLKTNEPNKNLSSESLFSLPKSIWKYLIEKTLSKQRMNDIPIKELRHFHETLHHDRYEIIGKNPNKDEFVTCGGISLSEVNFKTMESKLCHGLYFAGEILDIDGITGGFNLQNAWTTGYLVGVSCHP